MTVKHIYFSLFLLFILFIVRNDAASLSMDQSVYSVRYGTTVTITAILSGMTEGATIWRYYETGTTTYNNIYLNNGYSSSIDRTKYFVSFTVSGTNLISTLTIDNVQMSDSLFTFEVVCNIYLVNTCTANSKVSATLSVFTTTTTVTSQTVTSASNSSVCLEGSWNTVQYTLIILNFLVLIVASLLFHYSFYGTVPETFFLILTFVLSLILIITSLIFWINPTLSSDSSVVSVIIICCGLAACCILWILILQYSVRLGLNNEISLAINIIICVLAVLELAAAVLSVISNVYCTGKSSISALTNFNYSYLELIAALFLVLFTLFLLIIAGVIFFIRKKKKDTEKFSNLGKIVSPMATPFPPYSMPSSAKPRTSVQEMWKTSKQNINDEVILPEKPPKLVPIFSKKRGESFITDLEAKNTQSKTSIAPTPIETKPKVPDLYLSDPENDETPNGQRLGNPDSIWDTRNVSSFSLSHPQDVSRSKSMLGGRKVGDLSLNDSKIDKKPKKKLSKRNRSLSSVDKDNLIPNESDNSSPNDTMFSKTKSNSLTRISLS